MAVPDIVSEISSESSVSSLESFHIPPIEIHGDENATLASDRFALDVPNSISEFSFKRFDTSLESFHTKREVDEISTSASEHSSAAILNAVK
jgi:hypothetical protein